MIISVINHSHSISDEAAQQAIRTVNRQIAQDFEPDWIFGTTLRLEGAIGVRPNSQSLSDRRGDAVVYRVDAVNLVGVSGWHTANYKNIPCGLVFLGLCEQLHEPWSITLPHKALELMGDPMGNLPVEGADPFDPRHKVFHLFEMCEAVQCASYLIDAVEVSNFVLPSYSSPGEPWGRGNDLLARAHAGKTLPSLGMHAGAYLNIFDPKSCRWKQPVHGNDPDALRRRKITSKVTAGRIYRRLHPAQS